MGGGCLHEAAGVSGTTHNLCITRSIGISTTLTFIFNRSWETPIKP